MKLDFHTHKWIYAAASALVVLFGLIFLFLPSKNIGAFTVLMCIMLLIVGAMKIGFHFAMHNRIERYGWTMLDGICDAVIALLLMFSPAASLLVAGTLVGIWALFCSVNLIHSAVAMRGSGDKKGWIFLGLGILQAILSISMLFSPASTDLVATTIVGLFLITHGATLFIHVVIE